MRTVALAGVLLVSAACGSQQTAKSVEPARDSGVRTGQVKNIVIDEGVAPDSLRVQAGDEVRWLNHRQRPVVVEVAESLEGKVSCRNGFSKALSMGIDNSTTLDANESAGLCFSRLGTFRYSVRSEGSDDPQPLRKTQGTITVD